MIVKGVGKSFLAVLVVSFLLSSSYTIAQTNLFPTFDGQQASSFEISRQVEFTFCVKPIFGACAIKFDALGFYPIGWNGSAGLLFDVARANTNPGEQTEGDVSFDIWYTPGAECQLNYTNVIENSLFTCSENSTLGFFGFSDFLNIGLDDRNVELLYDIKICEDVPEKPGSFLPPAFSEPYGVTPIGGSYILNLTFFDSTGAFIGDATETKVAPINCSTDSRALSGQITCSPSNNRFQEVQLQLNTLDFLSNREDINMSITITSIADSIVDEESSCVTVDNFRIFALEDVVEDVPRTVIDNYIDNMTTLIPFPTSNVVNSGGLTASDLVLFTSKAGDGTLLARVQYTSSSTPFTGASNVVKLCKGSPSTCGADMTQPVGTGLRERRVNASGVESRVTIDFIIHNISTLTHIELVQSQVAGTVDVIFDVSGTSLSSQRSGVFTELIAFDSTGVQFELFNSSQSCITGGGCPDLLQPPSPHHYPIVLHGFRVIENASAQQFLRFDGFNFVKDPFTEAVTFEIITSGGVVASTSGTFTWANATDTTNEIVLPIDIPVSSIIRTTFDTSQTVGGIVVTLISELEHNFTFTEAVSSGLCTNQCVDFDSDGFVDDLQIFTLSSSGLCQRQSTTLNFVGSPCEELGGDITDPTALALVEGLNETFEFVGQSFQGLVDSATTKFSGGLLLAIWVAISISVGLGTIMRIGERGVDGTPYGIIATVLVFIGGFLLRNSTTGVAFVDGFFVVIFIVFVAFIFWWFFRKGTG